MGIMIGNVGWDGLHKKFGYLLIRNLGVVDFSLHNYSGVLIPFFRFFTSFSFDVSI